MTEETSRSGVFAVIAGGGTGGHIYPALAIADALVARGHPRSSIEFVGARRGLEGTLVPPSGFKITLLKGRGFQRKLALSNFLAIAEALLAIARCIGLLRKLRPQVVVGVGGYASLPCVVAARIRAIPVIIHEQNASPGLANRIAVRIGATPLVALAGTGLSGAVLVGNPVRSEIAQVRWAPVTQPRILAILGGSQGARTLNEASLELYELWRNRSDISVHLVAGPRNIESVRTQLANLQRKGDVLGFEVVAYEDNVADLYSRASLMICRAGAITVAELSAAGVPSVLVPIAGAPGDHQRRNAMALVDVGAAMLVTDAECSGRALDPILSSLLEDSGRLGEMSNSARELSHPDAALQIAELIEKKSSRGTLNP